MLKKLLPFALTALFLPAIANDDILQAEIAIKNGAPLSQFQHFSAHPLYPYLQYRYYKNNLDSIPTQTLVQFLKNNSRAPYSGWLAEHLYPQWLAAGQYKAIIDSYAHSFADESIECEWRLALLHTGERIKAETNIENLWLSADTIEPACNPLFTQIHLDQTLVAKRFQMVMQEGNLSLAKHLSLMLDNENTAAANIWIAVREGTLPLQHVETIGEKRWRAHALADILYRNAKNRLSEVTLLAINNASNGNLSSAPAPAGRALSRVSARLAQENNPLCEQVFIAIPQGQFDKNAVFDLIAYELRSNRWQAILDLLSVMSAQELEKPEYQYWLGKAYEKTGQADKAKSHYEKAATQRDFFGFLAAEKLGQTPKFNDKPLTRSQKYLVVAAQPATYRMKTFLHLGDISRARQEYKGLTYKISDEDLTQAALIASESDYDIQAIISMTKLKQWDALNVRFPIQYSEKVKQLASHHQISPATIFAIIRKESIFQPKIKSSAGAIGLMQVMPRTARYVANQYAIPYNGTYQLTDPDTNLNIGSQYLTDQIREYGHLAYAAAAYNAGPHRASQWLAENPNLSLDEWIAQIPFYETRDYVKRILEYERIYEYRLGIPFESYKNNPRVRPW